VAKEYYLLNDKNEIVKISSKPKLREYYKKNVDSQNLKGAIYQREKQVPFKKLNKISIFMNQRDGEYSYYVACDKRLITQRMKGLDKTGFIKAKNQKDFDKKVNLDKNCYMVEKVDSEMWGYDS
jgi:protoporphyrinogen oxidase